ncbi:MAG: MBL fold metallo-hydrolase [Pseudomonadota bacterium]
MALPPRPARLTDLAPGVRRVLAENPSPMTYWGTNSYIVGTGAVAVIDPGPADPDQIAAILAALGPDETISHIFVTHAHLDHSPGASLLAAETGAPVLAFGDAQAGRSAQMAALAAQGGLAGGEGVDAKFAPDRVLSDGAVVVSGDWQLEAIWTPGHFGNHLSYALPKARSLFCGDVVMGWASSLVSPPDGDLAAFMTSLDRLAARRDSVYYPGHGDPIQAPAARLAELRAHREMRGRQIAEALRAAPGTAAELAARIYTETPVSLLPAATRNVLAHLIEMASKKEAHLDGALRADSVFTALEE